MHMRDMQQAVPTKLLSMIYCGSPLGLGDHCGNIGVSDSATRQWEYEWRYYHEVAWCFCWQCRFMRAEGGGGRLMLLWAARCSSDEAVQAVENWA